MNILLVEDDQRIGASLRRFFEGAGHLVDWTADGIQALECASTAAYDAVVLALGVANLDGMWLCDKLRRTSSSLPILILTTGDDVADRLASFEAGADDVLPKPFDVDELMARLAAIQRRSVPEIAEAAVSCPRHMIVVDRAGRGALRSGPVVRLTDRERRLFEIVLDTRSGVGSLSAALLDACELDLNVRGNQAGSPG